MNSNNYKQKQKGKPSFSNAAKNQRNAQKALALTVRPNGTLAEFMVAQSRARRALIPTGSEQRTRARARNGVGRPAAAPSAIATGTMSMQPQIIGGRNSTRIVHRELVASIIGSASFAVFQTLALNPGLAATFPWLSSQAQSWEEYKFNRLKFCYYTRTGSSTPGSVQLVPDYDAADAAPASEQIASSFQDVVEDAPWKNLECSLSSSSMFPMGPRKFIRSGALAANLDVKTYDAGQLFICTTDGTAVNWGKLWVEYDVELSVPANPAAGSLAASSQHVTSVVPTTSSMLPTPVTLSGSAAIVSIASNVLTFLIAGRFFVNYVSSATTDIVNPTLAVAGGSFVATFGTAGKELTGGGSGDSTCQQACLVDAVIGTTLTFAQVVNVGLTAELFIAAVPSAQA